MNHLAPTTQIQRFVQLPAGPLATTPRASPMTLQALLESIDRLNEKLDALAVRTQQPIEVQRQELSRPMAKPVDSKEVLPVQFESPATRSRTHVKVNRSSLLDSFD